MFQITQRGKGSSSPSATFTLILSTEPHFPFLLKGVQFGKELVIDKSKGKEINTGKLATQKDRECI